jgi:hypothetical protein
MASVVAWKSFFMDMEAYGLGHKTPDLDPDPNEDPKHSKEVEQKERKERKTNLKSA